MKEGFHLRFATIFQIIYQKALAYFNNHIIITFDLANRVRLIKWCSIVSTQMLVVLTRWIERQKKVATNLALGKSKYATCYLRPVSNVLLRKWFPLPRAPSPCLTTQDEPMLPIG